MTGTLHGQPDAILWATCAIGTVNDAVNNVLFTIQCGPVEIHCSNKSTDERSLRPVLRPAFGLTALKQAELVSPDLPFKSSQLLRR